MKRQEVNKTGCIFVQKIFLSANEAGKSLLWVLSKRYTLQAVRIEISLMNISFQSKHLQREGTGDD